jgi:hypothetical protein
LHRLKPEPAIAVPFPLLFGESARGREDAASGYVQQANSIEFLPFGTAPPSLPVNAAREGLSGFGC